MIITIMLVVCINAILTHGIHSFIYTYEVMMSVIRMKGYNGSMKLDYTILSVT